MNAEVVSIGTELLMGELTDANASWIAGRLPALGIQLQWITIIGDDLGKLTEGFQQGMKRSDIIFTTGGLGPTQDDLTREAVAAAFVETPAIQQEVVDRLEAYFRARGTKMPSHNIKQALLIPSAQFVTNNNGTAPGWWAERDGTIIVSMPGPPGEMHAMFEEQVEPRLRELVDSDVTITRNVKTMGMSEGAVDEVMSEFFGQQNPYLGIYSKADGIHLRVIARAADEAAARAMIVPVERAIHDRLAEYIWGYDDETPERAVAQSLQDRGLSLAVMEYATTGGFLTNSITEVPDSAGFFKGGIVSSGNDALIANGVPASVLNEYGAVSQQTANAMAQAAREKLGADFSIGISAAPGPSEIEGKPMGLAYISISNERVLKEMELRVPPRRITIKRRISNQALIELRKLLEAGR